MLEKLDMVFIVGYIIAYSMGCPHELFDSLYYADASIAFGSIYAWAYFIFLGSKKFFKTGYGKNTY